MFLADCLNRRVTPDGLKDFYPIIQPVTDAYMFNIHGESKSWPFPQFFFGSFGNYLLYQTTMYTVDLGAGTATAVSFLDPADPTGGTAATLTGGYDWHFLDLGPVCMWLNGVDVAFTIGDGNYWATNAVTIYTGCAFKGSRGFLGGFNPANAFALADWPSYWLARQGTLPSGVTLEAYNGMEPNAVWASSWLAEDLLWLFQGAAIMATDQALDLRYRNESELHQLPLNDSGTVIGLVEFGDGVLAYGLGGIVHLQCSSEGPSTPMHFPSLGEHHGVVPGRFTRTHWGGTKSVQYFVDGAFEVWRLTPDMNAVNLHGSHLIEDMDSDHILVSYDEEHDELYVSDGAPAVGSPIVATAVMLSKGKFCKPPWLPTTVSMRSEGLLGIYFDADDPTTARITTGTMTTGSGQVEVLRAIWLKGLHSKTVAPTQNWKVIVELRTQPWNDFVETGELIPDSRGVVVCAYPVLEYRLTFISTVATGVTLEDVRYEVSPYTVGDTSVMLEAYIENGAPGQATEE